MLAIDDSLAGRFLDSLGSTLPTPKAIVIASAHFGGPVPVAGADAAPATVHDFGRFADELFRIRYTAQGDPALAHRIVALWREAGLAGQTVNSHGLDHGVWVPLRRMYPRADIPVVPLAIMPRGDASSHYAMGRALAALRDEGMLVIGSGGFVHNLGDLDWQQRDAPVATWADEFAAWMRAKLLAGDLDALLDWQAQAPHAQRAHPTVEHLMPLFVALGAAGDSPAVRHLHGSYEMGSLALDAFAFG